MEPFERESVWFSKVYLLPKVARHAVHWGPFINMMIHDFIWGPFCLESFSLGMLAVLIPPWDVCNGPLPAYLAGDLADTIHCTWSWLLSKVKDTFNMQHRLGNKKLATSWLIPFYCFAHLICHIHIEDCHSLKAGVEITFTFFTCPSDKYQKNLCLMSFPLVYRKRIMLY